MRVSLKWLKTMVDVPDDIRAFTERLDLTGTAVESVETSGTALENIVVGQILTRERHPDADKLWLTTVDVAASNLDVNGAPEALQIVCGAQNFVAGDKVPVAMVGAVLPDGNKIKKAKMRGVESRGMNCSARELGLGADHAGLMILPADAPVGAPISEYLGLSDTIIDLEITPNRPDCMSMLGVAREVGAIYDKAYDLGRSFSEPSPGVPVSELVRVSVEDAERCPRYTARVILGAKIGPSPDWLAERVQACGARSINNIVDATNYIMFELGQPLHAFDLDTLAKDADGKAHIVVRAADAGERFTTLDGVERVLDADITCIVDGNAAAGKGATVALAGVMGGLDSEITDTTCNILLESATFSNAHTSRTSRKLQLFSESSARYERGVDASTCDEFSVRAAALIAEVAGGRVCTGVVDACLAPTECPVLSLRSQRMCEFLGADIAPAEVERILRSLGCKVESAAGSVASANDLGSADGADGASVAGSGGNALADVSGSGEQAQLQVTVPSFRPDLTREIDLYEEVLRLWGMERVPASLPGGRGRIGERTPAQRHLLTIGRSLRASGLNQTMTYAFAPPAEQDLVHMPFNDNQQAVELVNPMNSEQSFLRRSILPGLLHSVAYNINHGVNNVHLYETGAVFFAAEGRKLPKERDMLCAALSGAWHDAAWNEPPVKLNFFDGKGVIENLLRELNVAKLRFKTPESGDAEFLQPGRAAIVFAGNARLGWLGEIHPEVAAAFDIDATVVAFELDLGPLIAAVAPARPYKDVPEYPAVSLDLAIVVDESVTAEKVMQVIRSAGGNLLDEVRLFDVYQDSEKLGAGKRSLALALTYRAPDRTLTAEEVTQLHDKVINKLSAATAGVVRA